MTTATVAVTAADAVLPPWGTRYRNEPFEVRRARGGAALSRDTRPCSPGEVERGKEVLVEFEPDPVA